MTRGIIITGSAQQAHARAAVSSSSRRAADSVTSAVLPPAAMLSGGQPGSGETSYIVCIYAVHDGREILMDAAAMLTASIAAPTGVDVFVTLVTHMPLVATAPWLPPAVLPQPQC